MMGPAPGGVPAYTGPPARGVILGLVLSLALDAAIAYGVWRLVEWLTSERA